MGVDTVDDEDVEAVGFDGDPSAPVPIPEGMALMDAASMNPMQMAEIMAEAGFGKEDEPEPAAPRPTTPGPVAPREPGPAAGPDDSVGTSADGYVCTGNGAPRPSRRDGSWRAAGGTASGGWSSTADTCGTGRSGAGTA